MGLIDKAVRSVKSYHFGKSVRSAPNRRLSARAEELARLATIEARAYTDQAIGSQVTQGVVTHEILEKKTLLSVQESKAYADSAIGGISSSMRAIANAVVEVSDRVERLTSVPSAMPGNSLATMQGTLAGLSEALGQIEIETGSGDGVPSPADSLAEAHATLGELNEQLVQIGKAIIQLESQITKLSEAHAAHDNDAGEATSS